MKLRCWQLAFSLYKAFLKSKKRFETKPPVLFFPWFLKKVISHRIFYQLTNFHCLIAFLEILCNMCMVVVCCPGFDVISFEINLSFFIKLFSHMKNIRTKIWISEKQKELLRWNEKHFSFLTVFFFFSLKQIKHSSLFDACDRTSMCQQTRQLFDACKNSTTTYVCDTYYYHNFSYFIQIAKSQ